jgi:hypothetical protein
MGKGYVFSWRKSMSPEDRRTFDRWLKGNALGGAIFAVGLLASSLLGSQRATPPDDELAGGPGTPVIATLMPK